MKPTVLDPIWKFHDWYDDLQPHHSSWRFFLMLVIASPIITATSWMKTSWDVMLLLAYTGLVLGTRVYRHHFIPRKRSE